MANEFKNKIRLAKDNDHLLDIFTDDYYLELGTIEYDVISNLLKGKLVEYTDIAYYDITKHGIGSMESNSKEMQYKLPFMHFYNIVSKNKSCILVITYGLLLQRKGYKETFVPMILIPVKMYLENDTIYFQMVSKPIENPYIKHERQEFRTDIYNKEKMDDIYLMDRYVMSFVKHQTSNVRLENYLTFVKTEQPEVQIHHEMFKLENVYGSSLTEKYSIEGKFANYNITALDQSQRNAVAIASKGNSFAITGYEGCGKTTTLINIASDAIKNGKRVLYVSNNDSTLSKVYETFKSKNLDSFVTSFSKPFFMVNEKNHEYKRGQVLDYVLKKELLDKYEEIEKYEKKLSTKIRNFPLIEIMNELILTPKPQSVFSEKIMKDSYCLYKYEINEIIQALRVIDEKMPKIGSFKDSHFTNIPITHQIVDINQPMHLIQNVYVNYSVLQKERLILEKDFGITNIVNYARFKNLISYYTKLNKTIVPTSWYQEFIEDNDTKTAFKNFNEAKKVFVRLKGEIEHYQNTLKEIKSIYSINKYNFDVEKAIDDITSDIFQKSDIKAIDQVLKDYIRLTEEAIKAKDLCNYLESIFGKMKSKLGYSLLLNDTKDIDEVNEYVNVFSKGYFSKAWLDFSKSEGILNKMIMIENTLDQYEESINVYSKYFDSLSSLDNNISVLEKKNHDQSSKYKHVTIGKLLPHLYFIRKTNLKVSQLKKEYKDLTYAEYKYKVHISDIYKELIVKHDAITNLKVRDQVDKSLQDLRSSGIVDIIEVIKLYQDTMSSINRLYNYFLDYKLVSNSEDTIKKLEEIRKVNNYMNTVSNWQKEMSKFLMIPQKQILFNTYLYFEQKEKELNNVNNSINNNKSYKFLFEKLFQGEQSKPNEIANIINDFEIYLTIFKNPRSLVQSFDNETDKNILVHIKNADETINDIDDDFLGYIKLFKDSVSKYYYDDLTTVINNFKTLLESRDELRLYLEISNQMKIILKYKLNDLNNYIIQNDKERVTNRFKYSYFNHIYNEYVKENPEILSVLEYNKSLEKITHLENDLIDSNVEILKLSNSRRFKTGKAKNMNFNQYIIKNRGSKLLFLSDTNIVNLFLDMTLFDLVLIDDAQLLNANEYYKAIKCGQVVIAGTEQLQTSISNSLISRIRHNAIMPLKYRYTRTPLELLKRMKNIKGRFYSDVKMNNGVSVCKDNYNSLIAKLIKNNNEVKINFFTSSLAKAHNIYQVIGNILYDKGMSASDISNFFEERLNICDLKTGYSIEADYNILDLSTYHDVDDEYISYNMADLLISCGSKLIILDSKNLLNKAEKNKKFVELVINILEEEQPSLTYLPQTLQDKISRSLRKSQIKTVGSYYPLSLVLEYDDKYYGLMIIENPDCTEFTVINEYREFKSNDFPISFVWLSDLVEDFGKAMQKVVKEITS